jgi:hypothetical protein
MYLKSFRIQRSATNIPVSSFFRLPTHLTHLAHMIHLNFLPKLA